MSYYWTLIPLPLLAIAFGWATFNFDVLPKINLLHCLISYNMSIGMIDNIIFSISM